MSPKYFYFISLFILFFITGCNKYIINKNKKEDYLKPENNFIYNLNNSTNYKSDILWDNGLQSYYSLFQNKITYDSITYKNGNYKDQKIRVLNSTTFTPVIKYKIYNVLYQDKIDSLDDHSNLIDSLLSVSTKGDFK